MCHHGTQRQDYITPFLSVWSRITLKVATLVYKIRETREPTYLSKLVEIYTATRTHRSSSANLLTVQTPQFAPDARSFRHVPASVWNCLPDNIRLLNTLERFSILRNIYLTCLTVSSRFADSLLTNNHFDYIRHDKYLTYLRMHTCSQAVWYMHVPSKHIYHALCNISNIFLYGSSTVQLYIQFTCTYLIESITRFLSFKSRKRHSVIVFKTFTVHIYLRTSDVPI